MSETDAKATNPECDFSQTQNANSELVELIQDTGQGQEISCQLPEPVIQAHSPELVDVASEKMAETKPGCIATEANKEQASIQTRKSTQEPDTSNHESSHLSFDEGSNNVQNNGT